MEVINKIDQKVNFRSKENLDLNSKKNQRKNDFFGFSPYYQIGYNGLFVSTVDLFSLKQEIESNLDTRNSSSLSNDVFTIFSMFYLHKINGIKKIQDDRIEFFNGDVYQFINDNRSYHNGIGIFSRHSKLFNNQPRIEQTEGVLIWERLFSKVSLSHFESLTDSGVERFGKEIGCFGKDRLTGGNEIDFNFFDKKS